MKLYVYDELFNGIIFEKVKYDKDCGMSYLGEIELDTKPEKKVVIKERTFDTILGLQTFLNTLGLLCPDKLKITYEIEE